MSLFINFSVHIKHGNVSLHKLKKKQNVAETEASASSQKLHTNQKIL